MVNQAFRIKIAYRSEKKKEEEENTRDRSVPDGSDNHLLDTASIVNFIRLILEFKCELKTVITSRIMRVGSHKKGIYSAP